MLIGCSKEALEAIIAERSTVTEEIAKELEMVLGISAVMWLNLQKAYDEFTPVQIRVYEDHIAIWNPGYLPNGWNIERLTGSHGSKPFNPDIANTFFRAGFIESWGRGIEKIADLQGLWLSVSGVGLRWHWAVDNIVVQEACPRLDQACT